VWCSVALGRASHFGEVRDRERELQGLVERLGAYAMRAGGKMAEPRER
jgi:hypothetical protein